MPHAINRVKQLNKHNVQHDLANYLIRYFVFTNNGREKEGGFRSSFQFTIYSQLKLKRLMNFKNQLASVSIRIGLLLQNILSIFEMSCPRANFDKEFFCYHETLSDNILPKLLVSTFLSNVFHT